MALGRRVPKALPRTLSRHDLPPPPAQPFYDRLNAVLEEAHFDSYVEDLCRPYYADGLGRPGLPPGIYFRMLFIGYFEGLSSQRGIAWRCDDSRSLRAFLGFLPTETTPDHSSLTKIRQRLPTILHEQVFELVLHSADCHGLLEGTTVGVDATFLEANASMKTIRRRDTGDDYKTYLRKLAAEAGITEPTEEELRRFDRCRAGKTASNQDWESPTAPDSRIAKMKDGTTHLAYKAEHVVNLTSDVVLAAPVYAADQADSATLVTSVAEAQIHLLRAETKAVIDTVAADKGYHKAETLAAAATLGLRTYIPEKRHKGHRVWTDKPAQWHRAYRNNRRRVRGARSKRLQRLRSERVERTFAHVCETGGGRRSWLRDLVDIGKRYLMQVAGHNLGVIMRRVWGKGTPRSLQGATTPFGTSIRAWKRDWGSRVINQWDAWVHIWKTAWFASRHLLPYASI